MRRYNVPFVQSTMVTIECTNLKPVRLLWKFVQREGSSCSARVGCPEDPSAVSCPRLLAKCTSAAVGGKTFYNLGLLTGKE
jgi:hypothetical protein